MNQSKALIKILKQQLKASGKTYAMVAEELGLSEASIKRLFSGETISIQRIEKIAAIAGLDLSDMFQLLSKNQQRITQLSREQEQEIAADLILLMIAISVINGFSFEDLVNHYNLSPTDCITKLAHLDRLKVIELQPNNRIKLKVAPNFHWLPNGPIQRFFQAHVEKDFFSSSFDRQSEKLLVLNGVLTPETNTELQKRMNRWAAEFNELMQRDADVDMSRRKGTTMVIALREWQYSLFKQHFRQK